MECIYTGSNGHPPELSSSLQMKSEPDAYTCHSGVPEFPSAITDVEAISSCHKRKLSFDDFGHCAPAAIPLKSLKDKSAYLPPCRVCNGPASGFHYGMHLN